MDEDNKSKNSSFYVVNSTKRSNLNFHYLLGSNQNPKFISDIGNLPERKNRMELEANNEEKRHSKKEDKINFCNIQKIFRNVTPDSKRKNNPEKNAKCEKKIFESQKTVRNNLFIYKLLIK